MCILQIKNFTSVQQSTLFLCFYFSERISTSLSFLNCSLNNFIHNSLHLHLRFRTFFIFICNFIFIFNFCKHFEWRRSARLLRMALKSFYRSQQLFIRPLLNCAEAGSCSNKWLVRFMIEHGIIICKFKCIEFGKSKCFCIK